MSLTPTESVLMLQKKLCEKEQSGGTSGALVNRSESRMRENRTSGSTSGGRKRRHGTAHAPAYGESRRTYANHS